APPAVPSRLEFFEVVAPPLSFLERLRKMNVTIALSATALLGVGVADNVSPRFDIGGEIRGQIFSFGLALRGMPPGTVYARERIDPSKIFQPFKADLSEWSVLLVPCARYKYFVGCAVAQGGADMFQIESGLTQVGFLSFGPRAGFEIPFG